MTRLYAAALVIASSITTSLSAYAQRAEPHGWQHRDVVKMSALGRTSTLLCVNRLAIRVAAELLQRMLAVGLSKFEPNPLDALDRIEAERATA